MKIHRVTGALLVVVATSCYVVDGFRTEASSSQLSATASRRRSRAVSLQAARSLDWSIVDAAYLITCPNADPDAKRLTNTIDILTQVGLLDKVKVMKFDTDDEDRIRGCYTSHISVLQDALEDLKPKRSGGQFGSLFDAFSAGGSGKPSSSRDKKILVLEDNMAVMGGASQELIDSLSRYAEDTSSEWDMINLSYNPYVPNLKVSRTENDNIVKLSCGIGSALGTTAYIINESGIRALVDHHAKEGYYAPIPDVMAEIFPETRVAAYPVPFVRAPKTKSLVNPQLDDLREVLFQPIVTAQVQRLLVTTGLSTNALLPLTILALLGMATLSGGVTLDAFWNILKTGSYDGPILLAVLSTAVTVFSLALIAQGILLAPKPPQTAASDVEKQCELILKKP